MLQVGTHIPPCVLPRNHKIGSGVSAQLLRDIRYVLRIMIAKGLLRPVLAESGNTLMINDDIDVRPGEFALDSRDQSSLVQNGFVVVCDDDIDGW